MDLATSEASAIAKQLASNIAAAYQPPERGRPSDIADAEMLTEFFHAVEAGNYLETAAELAGIHADTVGRWMKRGEEGEGQRGAGDNPFVAFSRAVKRLSRRAEALAVQRVRTAGQDPRFWAAEMTYLERRHPERWARRSEDNGSPKVLVQIGVGQGDVRVQVQGGQTALPVPGEPLQLTADAGGEE